MTASENSEARAPVRVAVVASHPGQYTVPLYRRLAARSEIDLTVLFASAMGTERTPLRRSEFGGDIVWDVDVLGGYRHEFLWNPREPHVDRRLSLLAPGIARALSARHYDVVVNAGWAYPVNWLAYATAAIRRIPYLVYCDTDVRDAATAFRWRRTRRLMVKRLFRTAAGGLYIGTFNRDFFIRHGMPPDRLWFSPYSVENDRYAAGDRDRGRERLGLDEDVCWFLFVGALTQRKRPDLPITAISELQRSGLRVGLVVVGSGPEEGALRKQVAREGVEDVRLVGFQNQADMPDAYASADVFVLPSDQDAHGVVVNEAMAAGLPPIVSSGTGLWGPGGLVEHERNGMVFPAGDAAALAERCRQMLDPATRERLAAHVRSSVERYSYAVAEQGWVDAIMAVSGARPRFA
jgi:glycosyltransferase involved in cell wall biosynthesis